MPKVSIAEEPGDQSCKLPFLPLGTPNSEWFPEQIMAYVQIQYQLILDSEKALALHYWHLGKALEALRKSFGHGHWEQFLKTSRLDKSKVFRARAIARTFDHEQDLAGLTAQQAYDRRQRKRKEPASQAVAMTSACCPRFAQFLDHVNRLVEPFIDAAGFPEGSKAAALLPAVEQVLAKFEMIRRLLQEHVNRDTPPLGKVAPD